jgi:hypothetical protein
MPNDGMVQTWVTLCGAKHRPVGPGGSLAQWASAALGAGAHRCECDPASESLEPCASCASLRIVSPRHAETSVRSRAARPAAGGSRAHNNSMEPDGQSTIPLTERTEASTIADCRRRATDVAAPHTPLSTGVRTLEKRPETCHFVPLSGPPGAVPRRRGSLGKPWPHHGIGPEVWAAGPSQNRVA